MRKKFIVILPGRKNTSPYRFHQCFERATLILIKSPSEMQVLIAKHVCVYFLIFITRIKGRAIDEDDSDDTAVAGMKTVQKEATVDLPRKVFAQLLHKGQFFQDIFAEQQTPDKIQFGHVCENPQEWEQRFEQKDLKINRHQGKVRWGNKNGGYGEHYWDLNHGGEISDEEGQDK